MKTFIADRLPKLTKIMYDSQQRLNVKNWESTLKVHQKKIEDLLEKIGVFDTWRNKLKNSQGEVAQSLIQEIFLDAYMSVHFACMALYKQAHVSLRAELETALRLVYFSTHRVEFKWWRDDKDYFQGRHVWGEEYKYFKNLEQIQLFEGKAHLKLFDVDKDKNNPSNVGKIYKTLSKYVHSGFPSFLTTLQSVAPVYKAAEFRNWAANFTEVQKCVDTILALGFSEEFKNSGVDVQRKILKVVGDKNYKRGLRQALNLKIKGRV